MAIEIKELHIKVKVEEEVTNNNVVFNNQTILKNEALTAEIIKKCTRNVLDILKEKQQR